jgi:hypothetical protein
LQRAASIFLTLLIFLCQFSLAFEDMSVDLPDTPLTVTRTYDSRDAKGVNRVR